MRNTLSKIAILVVFGCLAFAKASSGPRFDLLNAIDVVQLLAAGMCFGVALILTVQLLRGRSS